MIKENTALLAPTRLPPDCSPWASGPQWGSLGHNTVERKGRLTQLPQSPLLNCDTNLWGLTTRQRGKVPSLVPQNQEPHASGYTASTQAQRRALSVGNKNVSLLLKSPTTINKKE